MGNLYHGNADFNNETVDGKNEFHGTKQKCKHTDLTKVISEKRSTLKDDTLQILCTKPVTIIYNNRTNVDIDCLCSFSIDHSIWLLRKLHDTGKDHAVQIWSAYKSINTDSSPQAISCTFPLLKGSQTGWSNLSTAVKTVQIIRVVVTPVTKTIVCRFATL